MAAGEVRGEGLVVKVVTFGATVAVGGVVHLESDGKWDPVADADKGKFGVALDAGGDTETGRVVLLGPVDVTNGSTTPIPLGACVMAYTGGTVMLSDHGAVGENVGTALEAIAGEGVGTVYVGLVE
jgi:hypothetical protein